MIMVDKGLSFKKLHDVDAEVIEKLRVWYNNPEIKKNMIKQHEVSVDEHREWVDSVQANKNIHVWVAFFNGVPFGYASLTIIDYQTKTTNWGTYVGDPDYLGMGLAKAMLFNLMYHAFEVLDMNVITTKVYKDNEAIRGIHKKLGFDEVPGSEIKLERVDGQASFIDVIIHRSNWPEIRDNIGIEVVNLP